MRFAFWIYYRWHEFLLGGHSLVTSSYKSTLNLPKYCTHTFKKIRLPYSQIFTNCWTQKPTRNVFCVREKVSCLRLSRCALKTCTPDEWLARVYGWGFFWTLWEHIHYALITGICGNEVISQRVFYRVYWFWIWKMNERPMWVTMAPLVSGAYWFTWLPIVHLFIFYVYLMNNGEQSVDRLG